MKFTSRLLPFALGALAGCQSSVSQLSYEELYERSRSGGTVSVEEIEARLNRVRELMATPPAPEDRLFAAVLLLDSPEIDEVGQARDLALLAAQEGDDRGFRLAAEAIDRKLMLEGSPQRYGTQYIYSPAIKRWTLYTWDPATTDQQRATMGVLPLADALERAEMLNYQP